MLGKNVSKKYKVIENFEIETCVDLYKTYFSNEEIKKGSVLEITFYRDGNIKKIKVNGERIDCYDIETDKEYILSNCRAI